MGQLQVRQAHQPRVAVSHPSQVALHSLVSTQWLLLAGQFHETDLATHKPGVTVSQPSQVALHSLVPTKWLLLKRDSLTRLI